MTAGDKTADAGVPLAWSAATGMENIMAVAACDAGAKRLDIRSDKVTAPGSLWVAYGTADAGERISDWPHFACVGELDVGETFKQVRLPKGWSDEASYVRVFLLAPDALPDATRLASVSPRSALLKTSFRPTGQSRVEMDVQLGSGAQALFCSRFAANNTDFFSVMHNVEAGKLRYDYGTRPGGYISYGTVANSTRYVIAMGAAGLYTKKTDGTVNETLLFDIVPCRRNGVVALVDRKTPEVVSHTGTLAAGEMEFMGTGVIAQSATVSSLSGFVIVVR